MSDEALNAHLQWLDDCARAQVVDYETWLEGRVAQLEVDLAKTTRAMQAAIDAGGMAMSENQRLTKIVEDYEEENANLVERSNRAMTRAIQAEAKLAAIECAGCGKTMMECACDDLENG